MSGRRFGLSARLGLGLGLGLAGLVLGSGCAQNPTGVQLEIHPPGQQRISFLFITLIGEKTQDRAQLEVITDTALKGQTPPYKLNITPADDSDASINLIGRLRIFGFSDDGRGPALTIYSRLERFGFTRGEFPTKVVQMFNQIGVCGQDEGQSLGCVCYYNVPDHVVGVGCDTDPPNPPGTYCCGDNARCVPQQVDLGLPGNASVYICLAKEACPPGTSGCPCRTDNALRPCEQDLACIGGTCQSSRSDGAPCTGDDECDSSFCLQSQCCNPDNPFVPCHCLTAADCQLAYPNAEGIACVGAVGGVTGHCQRGQQMCQPPLVLDCPCTIDPNGQNPCDQTAFTVGCFYTRDGTRCCDLMGSDCECKTDSDCAQLGPGFFCLSGKCGEAMPGCKAGGCPPGTICGLDGTCCSLADGTCACSLDTDCQDPSYVCDPMLGTCVCGQPGCPCAVGVCGNGLACCPDLNASGAMVCTSGPCAVGQPPPPTP